LTGTVFLADVYEGLKHSNELLDKFQNANWFRKKLVKKDLDKCVFQLDEARERITKEAPRMGEMAQDYSESILGIFSIILCFNAYYCKIVKEGNFGNPKLVLPIKCQRSLSSTKYQPTIRLKRYRSIPASYRRC
jgi:hypothetical protein